jgi:hypothetical protein
MGTGREELQGTSQKNENEAMIVVRVDLAQIPPCEYIYTEGNGMEQGEKMGQQQSTREKTHTRSEKRKRRHNKWIQMTDGKTIFTLWIF